MKISIALRAQDRGSVSLKIVTAAVILFAIGRPVYGQDQSKDLRPVSVRDCICLRRVMSPSDLSISPNGKTLAYIAVAGSLNENLSLKGLYVHDLVDSRGRPSDRLLMEGANISEVHWLSDGRHLAVLTGESNREVDSVDALTGNRHVILRSQVPIQEYSPNLAGTVLAYTVQTSANVADGVDAESAAAYGFAVPFGYPLQLAWQKRGARSANKLFVVNINAGRVTRKTAVDIGKLGLPGGQWYNELSTSPDGEYLVFHYNLSHIPDEWPRSSSYLQKLVSWGATPDVAVLFDRKLNHARLVLNSPRVAHYVRWSDDGKAFSLNAVSPVGTEFERDDEKAEHDPSSVGTQAGMHLFVFDLENNSALEVSPGFVTEEDFPISWERHDDEMIVSRDRGREFVLFTKRDRRWEQTKTVAFPLEEEGFLYPAVGKGEVLVGVAESPSVPPVLYAYNVRDNTKSALSELNPEFRHISTGAVKKIRWSNKYGAEASGYLIYPTSYQDGRSYPLIINAYTRFSASFLCDVKNMATAFPPQPLAGAGFLVLMANAPNSDRQPTEFPGELGEAYNWIATIEGAVDFLAAHGLTRPDEVGLIGWSRTSWMVDFLLTHSHVKLKAASSADGGAVSYGSYWLWQAPVSVEYESIMGGPPYGAALSNWLQYTPAFNADKVQTPLLMEYTSLEGSVQQPYPAYEFFTALHRQGKPVELYYYPKGTHSLERPWERLASLQRNVDWFRFWMRDHEGEAPSYDPDQYIRWRKMREQQEWNERLQAQGKDPSVEFLRQTAPGAMVNSAECAPGAKDINPSEGIKGTCKMH